MSLRQQRVSQVTTALGPVTGSHSSSSIRLPYRARKFSSYIADTEGKAHSTTWAQLVWAAITVGKSNHLAVHRFGAFSLYEAIYRAGMVYANLKSSNASRYGYLKHSQVFTCSDPSEKTAVSYYFGLVMSKLFAEDFFDVPWLMHLDVYRDKVNVQFGTSSRVRPDLIGLSTSADWFVVEAKGASGSFRSKTAKDAKSQATKVISIDGKRPVLCAASVSYSDSKKRIRTHLEDPPSEEEKGISVDVSSNEFLRRYYSPLVALIDTENRYSWSPDDRFIAVDLPAVDVTVALRGEVYEAVMSGELNPQSLSRIINDERIEFGDSVYYGADGIAVELGRSWNGDLMAREPSRREL